MSTEQASPDNGPQFAWLIERHYASVLHYWTGRPKQNAADVGGWTSDVSEARRFARRTDAECMLTWHCEDIGNVVEHGFSQ